MNKLNKKIILISCIPLLAQFALYGIAYFLGLQSQVIPPWPVLIIGVVMGFYIWVYIKIYDK